MHALSLALVLAALSPGDLDRAASDFARAHPDARLVRAATAGLEHASGLAVPRLTDGDEANARAFLEREGAAFGVTAARDLTTVRIWSATAGGGTALFERTVEGWPVFGGRVAVAWRGDGAITTVNGARVLAAASGARFVATSTQAMAAALAAAPGRPGAVAVHQGWLQYEGVLEPAYRVEHSASAPFDSFVSYVAGDTGTLLYRLSRRRSAVALAPCGPCASPPCLCAFLDSPIAPPPPGGALANGPAALPARDLTPPGDRLTGLRTAAFGCAGGEADPEACTDRRATPTDGSFLASPDSTMRRADDGFAEQSAYYHIDDHSRFLDSLDAGCLATPAPPGAAPRCFAERTPAGGIGFVPGYVNAFSSGRPLENAYFSPSGGPPGSSGVMIFGQGALVDLSYDAEIVYHELTHAAVDVTSAFEELTDRFGANGDPGALNEGTADTFTAAHSAETLSASGTIEPASCLSSYFAAGLGVSCLRQAANVRTCRGNGPNDGRDPGRDGEVHDDGEIWTGFTWALLEAAHQHGLRTQVASALFRALESVGPHPTFDGYAATIRQAMADAGLPREALDHADCTIAQRDLTGCSERSLALFSGERALAGFFGIVDANAITTAGQQYFVDVPCGALALHVRAGDSTGRGQLLVRKGAPVEFGKVGLSDPIYDWLLPSNAAEATLDAGGCAACACAGARGLFGGGRWYFLPTGPAQDAGGNTNAFELGVSIEMPGGQAPPARVPYVFTPAGGDPAGPNLCRWGEGPTPSNRVPRAIASPATCDDVAAPSSAQACGNPDRQLIVGTTRAGCSTVGPGEGSLLAAALLALRWRARLRSRGRAS